MTSLSDPLKSDGHKISVLAREEGLGVNAPFLLVYLSQGQSFDIAVLNITQGTLTTTFTQYEYALTPAEADSITDYTDLEIRLVASCDDGACSAGGNRDSVSVAWAEFAVLDQPIIPPPTLDTVSVVNSTALQIDWSAPVDLTNVVSYDIRRFNGTTFNTVGNVLNGTTTFTNVGLIPDTFYTYHIVSVGASDESVPSNELSQRTTVILFRSVPDSNPSVRWVNGLGNAPCGDLTTYACVDDTPERDDGDFIQSINLGSSGSDIDIMTLSDIDDPNLSDSHFLKYTVRKAGIGTNPVEFTIQLRQGGSEIVSFTHSGLTTNYVIFQQELTPAQTNAITDYTDLEVTLTASCDAGCSNSPTARDKVNVSFVVFEIEQVSAPSITLIDTLSSSALRIFWEDDDIDAEITDIIIQRENGTDFINVANVSTSIFQYDDSGLDSGKIIMYRLTGMIPSGFAKTSIEVSGATPPSSTDLNGNGTTVEPNPSNTFTQLQKEVLVNTVRHFDISMTERNQIFTDIDTNGLNMYQIIDKMNNGSYSASQEIKNAGAYYGNKYLDLLNISDFINEITDDVRLALGGSNGTGDDPTLGVPKSPT